MIGLAYGAEVQKACPHLGHFTIAPPEMPPSTLPSWLRHVQRPKPPAQATGQARAAGLPLALSRMPATMLFGTGSKRNGSIEYAARPLDSERIAVA